MDEFYQLFQGMNQIFSPSLVIKNNEKSEKFRLKGNDSFNRRYYSCALEEYTKSLYFAEPSSLEAKYAYANRSALLFKKGYYAECIQDIERALKDNYPEEKKAQLLERQAKAIKLLPQQKKKRYHDDAEPPKAKNPAIPSAADCIKMSENVKYGTFIEATRDIEVGETLLTEKPYAFCLLKEFLLRCCSACGEMSFNLIPCDYCFALYCSEKCRAGAFELYHEYECVVDRFEETVVLLRCSPSEANDWIDYHLTLRIAFRAIKDLKTGKHGQNQDQYHSDCYEEVRNSITHQDKFAMDRPDIDFYRKHQLQKTLVILSTFTNIKDKYNLDDITLMNILLHCDDVKYFNRATVYATSTLLGQTKKVPVGHGFYSVFNRFNHSCCPNTTCSFYGSTLVVKSIRSIKAEKQCFVSYSVQYHEEVKKLRQMKLGVYYFQCDCKACIEDWPVLILDAYSLDISFGPTTKLWTYDVECYHEMKTILACVLLDLEKKNIKKEHLLKYVRRIYEKVKDEGPSPTLVFMDDILVQIFPQYNRVLEF